jgi:hypothetical protein
MVAACRAKPPVLDQSTAAILGASWRDRFLFALRAVMAASRIVIASPRRRPARPKLMSGSIRDKGLCLGLNHGCSLQGGSTGVSLSHRRLKMKTDDGLF